MLSDMGKASDLDRFHRMVGYVFAIGFLLFVGVPLLVISVMGECLPRGTAETAICDAHSRIEFFVLVFATPIASILVGWIAFRLSKFLG